MADPTNPNDPEYANNPNYVFSGGRWQYVSNPATANSPPPGGNSHVNAVGIGTRGINADPALGAGGLMNSVGASSAPPAAIQKWQELLRAGANGPTRDNPYSSIIANQTRPAQMALIEQMRAQQAGPSVAGLQAQQALGRNAMEASAAMGRGPLSGLGALGRQAGIGGGIAADAASARAQDALGAQRGMYGIASGMRGQDLRSAQDQVQAGLGMRGLDDANRQFYASQGANNQLAQRQAALENFKLYNRLQLMLQQENNEGQKQIAQGAGTALSFLSGL